MIGRYDGNLVALEAHERADDAWLDSRPKCDGCGEPIQEDHFYKMDNGEYWCEQCAQDWLDDRKEYIE